VDSILATYALLGGVFTAVRVFVAFLCGIVAGYLIELFCQETRTKERTAGGMEDCPELPGMLGSPAPEKEAPKSCCASKPDPIKRGPMEALRYGFVTLPADLAQALIIGLLLAGLITTLMPDDLLTGSLSSGLLAFLLATAISLPLYVCATASIPMAFALIAAGLSPGAALVFLITGPATNTATIATVWKMLGRKATAIYLSSLIVIAWLSGWVFNTAIDRELGTYSMHSHEALHPGIWQHSTGVLFIGLLLLSVWMSQRPKAKL
jgi:uncharacterized membrane protein YraQ (UPF0718 family)